MRQTFVIVLAAIGAATLGCAPRVRPATAPAPAEGQATLAQVYLWRARPGKLAEYDRYIRDVAEPIDHEAQRTGAFISITTYASSDTTVPWTHMRVFLLRDSAQLRGLSDALTAAGIRIEPDSAKRRRQSEYSATLRDRVGATVAHLVTAKPSGSRQLPNEIRWFRGSAEYGALTRQTYQVAGDRLPDLARGLPAQSWAVILDADETVLDNSEYQRRRFVVDSGYTDASWGAWVNERAATPVPGAPEFTARVHAAGGRVVIVTNRAEAVCDPTRANLQTAGIAADVVLCQPPGESDKNPRFQRVQSGTAIPGVPALTVVEWLGDNILDFPRLSQAARTDPRALAGFGKRYFILPNPMYGSWTQNRDP
jgi:5'-nucleotidase (lipoprotein e(P4) family)